MYFLRLFPEPVTHLKLIQVPRIFDESKEGALKIWLKVSRWGVFKSFQGQMLHVQCTSSSMLVTEIALTIFFLQNFNFFVLNFISLIVFINATRLLYNINFIFFN